MVLDFLIAAAAAVDSFFKNERPSSTGTKGEFATLDAPRIEGEGCPEILINEWRCVFVSELGSTRFQGAIKGAVVGVAPLDDTKEAGVPDETDIDRPPIPPVPNLLCGCSAWFALKLLAIVAPPRLDSVVGYSSPHMFNVGIVLDCVMVNFKGRDFSSKVISNARTSKGLGSSTKGLLTLLPWLTRELDPGEIGLTGDIGAVRPLAKESAVLMDDGILFQGGMTFLDESGCMLTSVRKTAVLDLFMTLDLIGCVDDVPRPPATAEDGENEEFDEEDT